MRLVVGNVVSVCMLTLAVVVAEIAGSIRQPYRLIVLLGCWFTMLYFSHCLSHYVVGRILGIEFKYF